MELNHWQTAEQKQCLSPMQAQSLKILEMSNYDLYRFLQEEQLENPILEMDAEGTETGETEAVKDPAFRAPGSLRVRNEDRQGYEEIPQAQGDSLAEHLRSQIQVSRYTRGELALFSYVIESLDEDGYLTVPADEIASLTGNSVEAAQKCIDAIRCMEPAGVGARDLADCLMLQLKARNACDESLTRMINDSLADVAAGHYRKIARQLSLTAKEVQRCVRIIHTLNPRPGNGFGIPGEPCYVVPDVMIDQRDGSWTVALNDKWMGSIGISRMYLELARNGGDGDMSEYLRNKIQRARFLLKSIEQRRDTLLRVTSVVLRKQKSFLKGEGTLVPMRLREIALELRMHESTVSRTIRDKYVQAPCGTYLFRELFDEGVGAAADRNTASSRQFVKNVLVDLIQKENPDSPFSDNELSAELRQLGVVLSRRTVAKYREELNLGNACERKVI